MTDWMTTVHTGSFCYCLSVRHLVDLLPTITASSIEVSATLTVHTSRTVMSQFATPLIATRQMLRDMPYPFYIASQTLARSSRRWAVQNVDPAGFVVYPSAGCVVHQQSFPRQRDELWS